MGHNAELYIVGDLRAPGFILTRRILFPLPLPTERGRRNWQNASGYNERSKVEAAISRYKHVIADTLKSRDDARRATEIAIAVKSLNRMRDLGQAICSRVRVAQLIPRRRQSTLRKLYATKCAIARQVGRDVELWRGLCRARNLARRNLKRNGRESLVAPECPAPECGLEKGGCAMARQEILDRVQKYVHPFRVTKGKGFQLKDFDPGDTRGLKLDKGEAAELLNAEPSGSPRSRICSTLRTAGRYCSFSRPWTQQARTARSSTSCPA